jgi:carbamoyltransferase
VAVTAILGISAFYHDSAAALVVEGDVIAAAQEERFTREKYDARFPSRAISYCLEEAGLGSEQLDYVVFYDKPVVKFERLLETYLSYAPDGWRSFSAAIPVWLKKKLFMRRAIRQEFPGSLEAPLVFLDHHESHAASAFFPSPFDEAAILTLDGVGEWSTATYGRGVGNRIHVTHQLRFPHSLGLLYTAFTYYCGFKVNSGEYKLMGLAPYGRPIYKDLIYEHLVDLKPDGSLWLNMAYFNYCQGLTMTNERFHELFGGPPRRPDSLLEQRHMDIAASIQVLTEDTVLRMGREIHRQTGLKNLVMAGGVALNCVANGRLLREGPFENIWIQPAAGDAGSAVGAALFVWHQLLAKPRSPGGNDAQKGSLLGPRYTPCAVEEFLDREGACYHRFPDEDALLDSVVDSLVQEQAVGWFHGRMEFGPRALGARSILGDPRSSTMQTAMNLKVKFRESFRPFAPCVLREHVHEWFAMRPNEDSPYMLQVAPVLEKHRTRLSPEDERVLRHDPDLVRRVNMVRSSVPAITHVDYSARVQTVDERHGRFHRLMKRFHQKTGCPMLINTSFNLSWEPIVMTPQQAYHTFMQSGMEVLVLEDCLLRKNEQRLGLKPWEERATAASPDSPWADPRTGDPLIMTPTGATNPVTGAGYPVEEGIPRLFVANEGAESGHDVTKVVKEFYEKTPFPNYDDLDNHRSLLEKARAGLFARLLNEQIPYGARVADIGCGTGQLTNFLAIAHRGVVGVDVCLNSLRLAQTFKIEHGIVGATFAQMNLFRLGLRREFFDVVISMGVLHHTADARRAFQSICNVVKPGGYVVVGLYNAYSRSLHYARGALVRRLGRTGRWLDPHFRRVAGAGKSDAWFEDQYNHPHETCHTLDEVLGWFDESGFDFVNSIPKPTSGSVLGETEELFAARDPGTALSRAASQLAFLSNGYHEGGFFIMIGRRRSAR